MNYYLKITTLIWTSCILTACNNGNKTETQSKIIPVKVVEIAVLSTEMGRNYVGTAEESIAVSLSFALMGTVEEVFVAEGQRASKGQLLASLNTVTAQNSYQAALAKLQQAQDAYDRLVMVHENGSLPDIKFVEVEKGLQQAKSMAVISKKNLDDCQLYAPRNGVIAARNVEIGSSVNPALEAFKLVSIEKIFVKIPVPENEISDITEGQIAIVTIPSLDNAVFTGKIEIKGVVANMLSHTYEVKIGIDNPHFQIMPGMVCKVSLARQSDKKDIVIPNHAVQISPEGKPYVWIARNDTAQRQFVKTGNLTHSGIIITEGIAVGNKLIIEGYGKISNGMKIKIDN